MTAEANKAVGWGWFVAGVLALAGAGYFTWRYLANKKPASDGPTGAMLGQAVTGADGSSTPGGSIAAQVFTPEAGIDNQAAVSAMAQAVTQGVAEQSTNAPPAVLNGAHATLAPATIDPYVDETQALDPLINLAAPKALNSPIDAGVASSTQNDNLINVLFG